MSEWNDNNLFRTFPSVFPVSFRRPSCCRHITMILFWPFHPSIHSFSQTRTIVVPSLITTRRRRHHGGFVCVARSGTSLSGHSLDLIKWRFNSSANMIITKQNTKILCVPVKSNQWWLVYRIENKWTDKYDGCGGVRWRQQTSDRVTSGFVYGLNPVTDRTSSDLFGVVRRWSCGIVRHDIRIVMCTPAVMKLVKGWYDARDDYGRYRGRCRLVVNSKKALRVRCWQPSTNEANKQRAWKFGKQSQHAGNMENRPWWA